MAKKKTVDDPVIETMLEAMDKLYACIIMHAFEEGGPGLAVSVMEGLQCRLDRQKADVAEVISQITERQ